MAIAATGLAYLSIVALTQAVAAPPAAQGQSARAPRLTRLEVTLLLNDAPAGDVTVQTGGETSTTVDVTQLVARLKPVVAPAILDALMQRAGARTFVSLDELRSEQFPIRFDSAALQLRVELPVEARSISDVSVSGGPPDLQANYVAPSDLSFGASFTLADRLQQEGVLKRFSRAPFTLSSQGFANVGGKDGVYLTYLAGLQEGGRPIRQRTTLFRDDEARAVRYSLGDITPLTSGSFSNPLDVFGIGVERLYQTIQPYRNLRPAGRSGLVLERPSRVEVYVNGAVYRTLSLAPGRYNLRDFPFLDGLNDVRLAVQDDTGRNESVALSFFSDTDLLSEDVSIFSAIIGLRRDGFGQFTRARYAGRPTFSGVYQRGFSDRITLGGTVQADSNNAFLTGIAVLGTPIGIFSGEAALDARASERLNGAVTFNYRLARVGSAGRQTRLDLDFQLRTRGFSPLERARDVRNLYRYDVAARFQQAFGTFLFGTATAGFSRGYGGQPDLKTGSFGLSRSFQRLNLTASYSYRDDGIRREHRGSLSLSVPLSNRQYMRASYDTNRNRAALDYTLQGYEGLGQTSAQLSVAREDDVRSANVQLEHFANRFRGFFQHDYQRRNGNTVATTDIALTSGVGYADGQWAIGRDPGRGFVMVSPQGALRGRELVVSDQYTLGPAARAAALGPALIPIQRQYQQNSLTVAAPDAPIGYDLGSGRLDIRPGAASGYRWVVGSAASLTLIGRITDATGQPMPYLAGLLKPVGGRASANDAAVPFFTNRNGRLVAQNVAPGRYDLVSSENAAPFAQINLAADAATPIDIGTVVFKE
ncbi:fimbria/pilus outer membrane usher protein [Sphingomonas sp. NBWT7]|uniref:fimbria/pilus outer membrane usher protein n=1 Tax=Sphingomonas sp. NBWT7 TaxID=2596913 RepID=UPI00162875D7|nr:fimbria/pilus outer membrane usher protein [Sphingomonas sp. NBWT7]QNE32429.1 fimbria/pilus outer membrane usher protein [Sphingomonas sp. NBWT7]